MLCALRAYRCDLCGKNNPKLQNGNIFLHFTCNYHLAHLILSSFFTQCITVTPQNVTDEAKLCIVVNSKSSYLYYKMLDTLITSKTRIKLLLKFFLNSKTSSYLRNLETEFGESTNSIRLELNKFEEAGLLKTSTSGNKKVFKANTKHPMFSDIQNILMKYTGLDKIVEQVISRLGNVEAVYLVGDLAKGLDSPIIDLILVGDIDKNYLLNLTEKAEKLINKKIRFVTFSMEEFEQQKTALLSQPHIEILN